VAQGGHWKEASRFGLKARTPTIQKTFTQKHISISFCVTRIADSEARLSCASRDRICLDVKRLRASSRHRPYLLLDLSGLQLSAGPWIQPSVTYETKFTFGKRCAESFCINSYNLELARSYSASNGLRRVEFIGANIRQLHAN